MSANLQDVGTDLGMPLLGPRDGPTVHIEDILARLDASLNRIEARMGALERAVGAMGALCACRAQPGERARS